MSAINDETALTFGALFGATLGAGGMLWFLWAPGVRVERLIEAFLLSAALCVGVWFVWGACHEWN